MIRAQKLVGQLFGPFQTVAAADEEPVVIRLVHAGTPVPGRVAGQMPRFTYGSAPWME